MYNEDRGLHDAVHEEGGDHHVVRRPDDALQDAELVVPLHGARIPRIFVLMVYVCIHIYIYIT